jgi:dTDP-4-dehydrorhamnose reductase
MLILLTGGSGRLGTELKKLRDFHAPSQKELDITKPIHPAYALYDLIVHCAAYTDVTEAEKNPKDCFMTNVLGTSNLAKLGVPILYISTEYVVDPTNYYAKSKLIGESILNDKSKILRLLFKPRPWPWKYAFKDQYTSGDYVDVIAKEVNLAIDLFGK